jgi:hypothetical protein
MAENLQFITDESIETLMQKYPAVAEATAEGVDISLLLATLRLTVAERIHRHQIALDTLNQLRKAVKL